MENRNQARDGCEPEPEKSEVGFDAELSPFTPEVATSVGLLLCGVDGAEAITLVDGLRAALWPGCRAEVIVLDDHGDPGRRALFEAVRDLPERAHFVPRPAGGTVGQLDAMTSTATCEFLLFPTGGAIPFEGLERAMRQMWVDGSDAALIVSDPASVITRDLSSADAAGRLAVSLGVGARRPPNRLVVMRRWVARWLLTDVERSLDPIEELADRGRLLGFAMAVVAAAD